VSVNRATMLLLLGFAIRESFSFWTGHPFDFELWVRLGYAVTHGGDPYGILAPVPGLSFANIFSHDNAPTVAYLPFWALVTGSMYAIYSRTGIENRFLYYFLLKQPVIVGDVVLAYLLFSYVSARRASAGTWVLAFWLFSPFTVIISGIWGMFDSIAICFVMLSAMAVSEIRRAGWTGWAVFVKSIPVIYAAPMTLRRPIKLKAVVALFVAFALPSALSAATILAMHWSLSTVNATLVSTVGKGGPSMSVWDVFYYLVSLGVATVPAWLYTPLGFLWIPAIVGVTFIAVWTFRTETDCGLFQALLAITLVFLIFKARITEQYALYFFSLAAVDVALWHPERRRILLASVAIAMIYLVVNNLFLVRFLAPIYPGFGSFEAMIYSVIGSANYTVNFLSGTAFTILNIKYLVEIFRLRNRPAPMMV